MFIVTCPNCAKPVEVSLTSPAVVTCDACGSSSPMPEAAARELQAAAELVRGLDVRGRQLSAFQRRAVSSAGCLNAAVIGLILIFLLPALGLAAFGTYIAIGDQWGPWGIALAVGSSGAPFLVLLLTTGPGLWLLRRSRRMLRAVASALPPRRPGSPARCRLCAGDLVRSRELVARCGYCGTDNVIDSYAMSVLAGEQHRALETLSRDLARNVEAVKKDARRTSVALAIAVVGGPLVAVGVFIAMAGATAFIELPANDARWYALVDIAGRRCAVETAQDVSGEWIVRAPAVPLDGVEDHAPLASFGRYQTVHVDWFVGRSGSGFSRGDQRVSGRIESVYAEATGRNLGKIGDDEVRIAGFCVGPEPTTPPTR